MRKKRSGALGKQDWISGARKLLIKSGIANVKVEPLAKALNVTTGSFYWHFAKREDLYDALLQDWYDTNTAPLHRAVEGAGPDPRQQYLAFFGVWVLERDFNPAYDQAIRDWAKTSSKVARMLQSIDEDRIDLLHKIFQDFGYHGLDATMRARVTYYHQLGYYALKVREKRETRLELAPYYDDILTGNSWLHELKTANQIREGMLGNAKFEQEWNGFDRSFVRSNAKRSS